MPEISRFYGIIIRMFFKPTEHEPSHIHAYYGERLGIFELQTFEMVEGHLPNKAQELIRLWMTVYKDDLLKMWQEQKIEKLPPLE